MEIKGKHAELKFYLQFGWVNGVRSGKLRINPEWNKLGILTAIHELASDCYQREKLTFVKLFIQLPGTSSYSLTLPLNLPPIEQGEEIIRFTNTLPFN
jgi:hypothetical protein